MDLAIIFYLLNVDRLDRKFLHCEFVFGFVNNTEGALAELVLLFVNFVFILNLFNLFKAFRISK